MNYRRLNLTLRPTLLALLAALMVTAAQAQPVAEHAQVFLNQGETQVCNLVASNYEGGPGPVTVTITAEPSNGTLVELDLLTYQYTPDPDFWGLDKFRWFIHNGAAASNIATCFLGVNKIPVVFDQTVKIGQDKVRRVQLKGSDDGRPGPYTVTIEQPPVDGTLTEMSWYAWDYTPDPGFYGEDSFQLSVDDGMATSNIGTVSITVNQKPVASSQQFQVLPGLNLVNWLGFEDDGLPGPPTAEVGTASHGTVTLLDPQGRFEYVPDAGYSGPDSFSWRVFDGYQYSSWENVNLYVQEERTTDIELGISFPLGGVYESIDVDDFNTQHFTALNVTRFRFHGGNWARLEPVEGFYNWASADSTLEWALANGYSAFFTIPAKTPEWACDSAKQNGDLCVPTSMTEFAAFVDALLAHLADFEIENGALPIHTIAFGNEWAVNSTPVSYPGEKEDYEEQQNIVYDAVKLHLPNMPVAVGGMSAGSTQTYAYCKGYLELPLVYSRETHCVKPGPAEVIEKTEYVLGNARYDVLDQHFYDFVDDWPHMLTALVNEALPLDKSTIPILASEFGGPKVGPGESPDPVLETSELDSYINQLTQMPLTEALMYRLVEDGHTIPDATYRYSGLIDRDRFDEYVAGGSPDIEKDTYWVFQGHALLINP